MRCASGLRPVAFGIVCSAYGLHRTLGFSSLQARLALALALALALERSDLSSWRRGRDWLASGHRKRRPSGGPSPRGFASLRRTLGFSSLRWAETGLSGLPLRQVCWLSPNWRRGRDWLRFAPGLCPNPAGLPVRPAASPNLGSHPSGTSSPIPSPISGP